MSKNCVLEVHTLLIVISVDHYEFTIQTPIIALSLAWPPNGTLCWSLLEDDLFFLRTSDERRVTGQELTILLLPRRGIA